MLYLWLSVVLLLLAPYTSANLFGRFTSPATRIHKGGLKNVAKISSPSNSTCVNSHAVKYLGKCTSKNCKSSSPGVSKDSKQQLTYFQTMMAGAISRTLSQFIVHPINTYKTLLQLQKKGSSSAEKITLPRLMKGWDAQLYLSLPNGAISFVVTDKVKAEMTKFMPKRLNFLSDFASSAVSTVICSIISTPQMVLADRLMAGMYPTMTTAFKEIMRNEGIPGFYAGWWPSLVQKIPSYGITWMAFQQMKDLHVKMFHKKPSAETNFVLGAIAAAASVSLMIPLDTIKTRIVTQSFAGPAVKYNGVVDCFTRILKEEGPGAFYRSLPPRLISVVPMMALQFGIFEYVKNHYHLQNEAKRLAALPIESLDGEPANEQ